MAFLSQIKKSQSLPTYERIVPPSDSDDDSTPARCIGVARVTLQSADIHKKGVWSLFRPNPFVRVGVAGHAHVAKTDWASRTFHPNWHFQTRYVMLHSVDEKLNLAVLNRHTFWWPTVIGCTSFLLTTSSEPRAWSVQGALAKPKSGHSDVSITESESRLRGYLTYDVFFYPATPFPEDPGISTFGLVGITVHEIKGFECDAPVLATVALGWNKDPLHITKPVNASIGTGEGFVWNSMFEFLCPNRQETTIVIKIFKVTSWKKMSLKGHFVMPLQDLLYGERDKWVPLMGHPQAQLRLTVEWRNLNIPKTG